MPVSRATTRHEPFPTAWRNADRRRLGIFPTFHSSSCFSRRPVESPRQMQRKKKPGVLQRITVCTVSPVREHRIKPFPFPHKKPSPVPQASLVPPYLPIPIPLFHTPVFFLPHNIRSISRQDEVISYIIHSPCLNIPLRRFSSREVHAKSHKANPLATSSGCQLAWRRIMSRKEFKLNLYACSRLYPAQDSKDSIRSYPEERLHGVSDLTFPEPALPQLFFLTFVLILFFNFVDSALKLFNYPSTKTNDPKNILSTHVCRSCQVTIECSTGV